MDASALNRTQPARLWTKADVMQYTGWGKTRICDLQREGKLPYIKGRPVLYVEADVIEAIKSLSQGGKYGKLKGTKKTK